MEVVEMKPLSDVRYTPPRAAEDGDTPMKITLTIPKRDVEKLYAWMDSDDYEKARVIREADFEQGAESVAALLRLTREHLGTSGGRVAATLLGSLYNGARVKLDASDLKLLDQQYFEHAMRAIRVCCECHLEPHQFFRNGGELFEHMIKTWGLEKRRRASR